MASRKATDRFIATITQNTHLDVDATTLRALADHVLDTEPEESAKDLLSRADHLAEYLLPLNGADLLAVLAPAWRLRERQVGIEAARWLYDRRVHLDHVHMRGPVPAERYADGLRNGKLVADHDLT